MGEAQILELARGALVTGVMLALPLLATAITIGLTVSVIQTATSVQEQSLTFVPKLLGVGAMFAALLPWLLERASSYLSACMTIAEGLAK